ncbi:MAG: RNHCP domain-containing protein [Oscillospiraceae bacterium]|nr:RNHCP domain-containing protein [Oscillospiraceae bacterium]
MSRKTENTGFICAYCGADVQPLTNGSYRNHCPQCFYSIHIDDYPGDRASDCLGLMVPSGVRYHSKKGWQIVHRCQKCGVEKVNRTAPDDTDTLFIMMNREGFC